MYEAKGQAELYVRNLPASEHNPPFIIVADVGHSMELFSDFSRQGRTYIPFPDPRTHRLKLRDLAEAEIRERLKQVWTEPLALDPSRRTAKVTREVAAKLAELARSLEHSGYAPDLVAHFLMRCLFTFFAEDVGLLPRDCFTAMLSLRQGDIVICPHRVGGIGRHRRTAHLARKAFTIRYVPFSPAKSFRVVPGWVSPFMLRRVHRCSPSSRPTGKGQHGNWPALGPRPGERLTLWPEPC